MKISDLLSEDSILMDAKCSDKECAINLLVELMEKQGNIEDVEVYKRGVFEREADGSTGIGDGIAIPHCKSNSVRRPGVAAMVIPDGVEFDSLDGAPVTLAFLIAAPDTEENAHLEALSKLSILLLDQDFNADIRAAKTKEEFFSVIKQYENGEEVTQNDKNSDIFIAAVTACPTGIAHTYIAAEALEAKAKELGYNLKVETRGSGGAKNVLTEEDIEKAKTIIVAADTKVPMERFDGKNIIQVKVSDGINRPEELIKAAVAGEGEIYVDTTKPDKAKKTPNRVGHAFYKHLMNGVSHMLPFVIGGGIMIAIAFLIDTICGYGLTGGGDFGKCTPFSAFFNYTGGLAMGLMVPVLAGYIAFSIADRPGLAVGFVGGLLAAKGNAFVGDYLWAGQTDGFNGFIESFGFTHSGNTVSGFLGGIAAGFLAGAIILLLKKLFAKLPKSLDGLKPTLIYPVLGIFIIAVLMTFIFNPLIALINTGLGNMLTALSEANLLLLLGLILGAMMAIDMGGPINKAAYVFGTGMLETAQRYLDSGASMGDTKVQACYIAMAAIMAGGMVPPIGIAIACKIFPQKFTKAERSSWLSNIVMGCAFITEGAIPFAAADPGHVIPCTMAGAGVAGLLSALFGCTLMAPHGGVFVFATIGNPLLYIVACVVGALVTALLLGVIKKAARE